MTTLAENILKASDKHRSGDNAGAVALCRQILTEESGQPDALHILGAIAHRNGNAELALKMIEGALSKRLDAAHVWLDHSRVLNALGRFEDALKSAAEAARLEPKCAEAWNVMGLALDALNRVEQAHDCHQHALALKPNNTAFLCDDALTLYAMQDLRGAYRAMKRALAVNDSLVPLTLANILKSAGYPARALPYIQKSRAMLPHQHDLALNEALAHLQIGDYAQGFDCLESRPDLDGRFRHLPFWKGATIDHLLLHEDQGFGDALFAARYIPLLGNRAGRITLQIAESLRQVFAENFPMIDVIALDAEVPAVDARLRLMSLPYLFKTRIETIPADVPYIKADRAKRRIWRERLAHIPHPRIGIVWGGNPSNSTDHLRSLSASDVKPLLQTGGAHFVSLQKGQHREKINLAAHGIFDAAPLLEGFSMTAALMAELDLVITTCTSTAHLAGALGRSCWLMLSFDPHWVWMLGREDSPWYPATRLFRQTEPFVWKDVIERVCKQTQLLINGDRSCLTPPSGNGAPCVQNPHAILLPEN